MSEVTLPRMSDSQLLRIFIDHIWFNKDELGLSNETTLQFDISDNTFYVEDDSFDKDGSFTTSFLQSIRSGEHGSTTINNVILEDPSKEQCKFSYERLGGQLLDRFKHSTSSRGYHKSPKEVIEVFYHLEKLLHSGIAPLYVQNEPIEVFSAHHEILTKLESFNASLITKQHEYIKNIEQEKKQHFDLEEQKYQNKAERLDADYRAKQEQIDTIHNLRVKELDDRQSLIEDADNTTARRKTTTKVLEEVQKRAEKFNFSSSVLTYSGFTIFFSIILLIAGGVTVFLSINELQTFNSTYKSAVDLIIGKAMNNIDESQVSTVTSELSQYNQKYVWFLYIRIFFGSALFISSTLYLIKFFNSWANKIAQQELDNQKFVRDLNRAHLAVEMSLEWNDKKDGTIPDRLLESLTEGLFQDKASTQQEVAHPAEQLASALVRSSEKIKMPIGTSQMEISGKDLSKIKRQKTPKTEEST